MERWKPVVGYANYEVSSLGRIRSLVRFYRRTKRYLTMCCIVNGYRRVQLTPKKGKKTNIHIHRLVLTAFRGKCPDGMEACHNDGNKLNNKISNLRWDTRKNNLADRIKHGTAPIGENAPNAKYSEQDVLNVWRLRKRLGASASVIAKMLGFTKGFVETVIYNRHWKHLHRKVKTL